MSSPTDPRHVLQPTGRPWSEWLAWARAQPASVALATDVHEIGDGLAVIEVRESILPANPNGAVHGGLVAALADHVGALAAITRAPAGHGVLTCSLTTDYLRPSMLPVVAVGKVLRSTRSMLFLRIEMFSGGELCASGSGNWLIRPYPAGIGSASPTPIPEGSTP